jgi:hypothetical protein
MKAAPSGPFHWHPGRAFETACELASDPGLVGLALKQFTAITAPLEPVDDPLWLLREADRWRNPWQFLLGVRDVPKGYRKVFVAADSQRYALLRFCAKAQRTGSLTASEYDRLLAALASGDNRRVAVAMNRIWGGMYRTDRGRFLLRAARARPGLEAHIESMIAESYAKDVRKLGRCRADQAPTPLRITDCTRQYVACDRIAFAMACGWLRGDKHGFPGLCFCSDEVVSCLLGRFLNLPVELGTVRKLRQRLRLKKAVVLVRKFRVASDGVLELSDSHGKPIWRSVPLKTG